MKESDMAGGRECRVYRNVRIPPRETGSHAMEMDVVPLSEVQAIIEDRDGLREAVDAEADMRRAVVDELLRCREGLGRIADDYDPAMANECLDTHRSIARSLLPSKTTNDPS